MIEPKQESKLKECTAPLFKKEYPIYAPHAYVKITKDSKTNKIRYTVIEPILLENEVKALNEIKQLLTEELEVDLRALGKNEVVERYLKEKINELCKRYKIKLKEKTLSKLEYFIIRDFIYYGKIDPLMRDHMIEDISCLPFFEVVPVQINEDFKLVRIGELIEDELKNADEIETVGNATVAFTKRPIKVISFNPKTLKTSLVPISRIVKRLNPEGYFIKINAEGGRTIHVSPDHPIIIVNASGLAVKLAKDLKIGEFVLAARRLNYKLENPIKIDLINEFSKLQLSTIRVKGAQEVLYKEGASKLARRLGVKPSNIHDWRQSDSIPLKVYVCLETDKSTRSSLKLSAGQGIKNWVPAVIPLTTDLGKLIGFYLSGGCLNENGIIFSYNSSNQADLYMEVQKLLKEIFNAESSLIHHKGSGYLYTKGVTLRLIFEKILELGANSYAKTVPRFIFAAPKNVSNALLDAYFLGDNTAEINYNQAVDIVPTASVELMHGIHFLLMRSPIIFKKCNWGGKRALEIQFTRNNLAHLQSISSSIIERTEMDIVNMQHYSPSELCPSFLVDVTKIPSSVNHSVVRNSIYVNQRISSKFIEGVNPNIVSALLSSDVYPAKVVELQKVPYNGMFYDFEVRSPEHPFGNFLHGMGLFTHNCDAPNVPIYVWHREFESIPTNISFENEELDSFVVRLAHKSEKHISIAQPMLDAGLPDGSRVQMTLGKEVTKKGSTFTIRKFRADPLTVSDLIQFNTLSSEMAAYLWYIIENRHSIFIVGGMASGKTTTLNCLSMFIRPELKVVSIEDTPELNIPHENWIQSIIRTSYGGGTATGEGGAGEITLFDLLKASLRQRPDYIIVGEIRGAEAYTLFQAMGTGHLALSTMHADSVPSVIHRLESEPMKIPRILLKTLDVVAVILRTKIHDTPARRVVMLSEIAGQDPRTNDLLTSDTYSWDPISDKFHFNGRSILLEKIAREHGLTLDQAWSEIERRKTVLEWAAQKSIRRYLDVANIIRSYYADPENTYRKAKLEHV